MVAASVPDLPADRVTVVDHVGRLLSGGSRSGELALTEAQLRYKEQYEDLLVGRIESMLMPIVGLDGVRAQVAAEIDFTRAEETREAYSPDNQTVRSQQRDLLRNAGTLNAAGIPGALSNQPPAAGVAPELAAGQFTAAAEPGTLSDSSIVNYELDRTVSRVQRASGIVERLSVAVLLNHITPAGAAIGAAKEPLGEEDVTRIDKLVREAVGLNAERGDSLNITNIPFLVPEAVELPPMPMWEQAWVPGVARVGVGGVLALMLILLVLRPVGRTLTTIPPATPSLPQPAGAMVSPGVAGTPAIAAPGMPITSALPNPQAQAEQMGAVRDMAREDPKKVSQVVKTWIADGE